MSVAAKDNTQVGRFRREMVGAVTQIREAYARMLELRCPGSKTVSEVGAAFGIHRKLAWQVIKVAYAEDALVASRHMPTGKSNQLFLAAARSRGVAEPLVSAAAEAFARFEQVVEAHAADRNEFEMMVESFAGAGDVASEEKWRQHSFLGNSFTLGAHCRVLLAMCVLMPSEDREHYFHSVQVRGLIGFRQTRAGVRWVVNQSVVLDDNSCQGEGMDRMALDPAAAAAHNGVPVMPEFCSDPVPALSRRPGAGGVVQDEFQSLEIGSLGERTLVTGEILRNIAPVHATERDRVAHFGTAVRTPTEMLHFDLFVRAGLFGAVERELRVFSDLASPVSFEEQDALSVSDRIVSMGRGVGLAQAPDLPGYADLASSVFDRLGVDASDYELYRVRMAYAPMPTTVMVKHALLPRDGEAS